MPGLGMSSSQTKTCTSSTILSNSPKAPFLQCQLPISRHPLTLLIQRLQRLDIRRRKRSPEDSRNFAVLLGQVLVVHHSGLDLVSLVRRHDVKRRIIDFEDLAKIKATLIRDREGLDAEATVDRFVDFLRENPFQAYVDDALQCLAVVVPPAPGDGRALPTLATLNITKSGWLTNVAENVFAAVKKEHPQLVWTVNENDENLTWFFEKADGSFNKNGNVLFGGHLVRD